MFFFLWKASEAPLFAQEYLATTYYAFPLENYTDGIFTRIEEHDRLEAGKLHLVDVQFSELGAEAHYWG